MFSSTNQSGNAPQQHDSIAEFARRQAEQGFASLNKGLTAINQAITNPSNGVVAGLNNFNQALQTGPTTINATLKSFSDLTKGTQTVTSGLSQSQKVFDQFGQQVGQVTTRIQQQTKLFDNNVSSKNNYKSNYGQQQQQFTKALQVFSNIATRMSGPEQGISNQYQALNQRYHFDTAQTEATRQLTAARLQLGQALAPYEQAKMKFEAGFMSSPAGLPTAIASDVLPTITGFAQLATSLKGVFSGVKAGASVVGATESAASGILPAIAGGLGMAGKAGLLGLAVGAGALVGTGVGTGISAAIGDNKGVDNWINKSKVGTNQAYNSTGGSSADSFYASMTPQQRQQYVKQIQSAQEDVKSFQDTLGPAGISWLGDSGGEEKRKQLTDKILKDLDGVPQVDAENIKKALATNGKSESTLLWHNLDQQAQSYLAGRNYNPNDTRPVLDSVLKGQGFQLSMQQMQNQVSDFQYSQAQSKYELNLNTDRSRYDLNLASSRNVEDYTNSEQKLNVSRLEVQQDYSQKLTDIDRQGFEQRRSLTASTQDLLTDTSKGFARLAETSKATLDHLAETTANATSDTMQDYSRNSARLSELNTRNNTELNRNFGNSLLDVINPSLSQNRGFQIARLMQQYQTQKSNLASDYQYEEGNLDISKSRSLRQIDQNRRYTQESVDRDQRYTSQDLNTTKQRGLRDIGYATDNLNYAQNRDKMLAKRDYDRANQQLDFQQRDLTISFQRNAADINTQLTRLSENFNLANQSWQHANDVFARDFGISMQQMQNALADQTGSSDGNGGPSDEIKKAFDPLRNSLSSGRNGGFNPPNVSSGLGNGAGGTGNSGSSGINLDPGWLGGSQQQNGVGTGPYLNNINNGLFNGGKPYLPRPVLGAGGSDSPTLLSGGFYDVGKKDGGLGSWRDSIFNGSGATSIWGSGDIHPIIMNPNPFGSIGAMPGDPFGGSIGGGSGSSSSSSGNWGSGPGLSGGGVNVQVSININNPSVKSIVEQQTNQFAQGLYQSLAGAFA
jgi:hypothetical protein